jgi:hypothetical protein
MLSSSVRSDSKAVLYNNVGSLPPWFCATKFYLNSATKVCKGVRIVIKFQPLFRSSQCRDRNIRGKVKGKVLPVLNLIKHYAMKAYGGVDV